jgi:hypothetical protein
MVSVILSLKLLLQNYKKYKSRGNVQIPAELVPAGGEILVSAIHKLINSIWNKDQWKESIVVLIHKNGDNTDCNNYRGISLLSMTYKMLSNILLSRLSPYIYEMIGNHQCNILD